MPAGMGWPWHSTLFFTSQGFQPPDEVWVRLPFTEPTLTFENRLSFCQRLALGFEINSQVLAGGVDAGVTQPVGDGAEVNPGTQQVYGGAVPPMPGTA